MNDAPTPSKGNGKAKAEGENGEAKAPRRSKFAELYPDDAKITLHVKENPKKEGSKSHVRFEGHFKNKSGTVKEALEHGVTYQDIAYEVGRGFISVAK